MRFLRTKLKEFHRLWLKQWEEEAAGDKEQKSVRSLLIRLGSALALYVVLDRALMLLASLPPESFYEPFIYLAFLKSLLTGPSGLVLVPVVFFFVWFRKSLWAPWTDLPRGRPLRFLILLCAGLLVWRFTTYDYNLYFDQAHYPDRLLLAVFLLLIYWRPVFVLPFLTVLLPVVWQFAAFGEFSWAAAFLPIRILVLFLTFFLLRAATKKFPAADFVFFLGCLVAAHYWPSGFGKLRWQWIRYEQLNFLLPGAYANGWLAFVGTEQISAAVRLLGVFNLPLKIFTLVLECGALLFFWNRYSVRFFLAGWAALHLGIFLATGIFFWMWVIVEIALLWLFLRRKGFADLPSFSRSHLVISILLIISGPVWCNPVKLVWYDVPISYTYRFVGIGEDGRTYRLPAKFFAPYDYQFTLSAFSYLDNKKPLLSVVQSAGPPEIMNIDSVEEMLAYERTKGRLSFNAQNAAAFRAFVRQFVGNWNRRLSKDTPFSYLEAPRLIWTFPTSAPFDRPQRLRRVDIIQVTSFYQNYVNVEIRREVVDRIRIPAAEDE